MRSTQKSTNFFKQGLCSLAILLAVLLAFTANAMGQTWFGQNTTNLTNRGTSFTNTDTGTNNHARIEPNGTLTNSGGGRIATIILNGGTLNNLNNAVITTATLNSGGTINNAGAITNLTFSGGTYGGAGTVSNLTVNANASFFDWGNLTTATVNGWGELVNRTGRTIGTATLNSGGLLDNRGTITNLIYNGGGYTGSGTIGNLTVNTNASGFNWGNLTTATVNNNGILNNATGRTIGTAVLNGGRLENMGRIDRLVYTGGTYRGIDGDLMLWNGKITQYIRVGAGETIGELQIGNGGHTDAFRGLIVNNNRVTFNHTNTLTHACAISGSGSLTKMGTGTLILSGFNDYTGNTTISGGGLTVTGSLGNSFYYGAIENHGVLTFQNHYQRLSGNITGTGSLIHAGNDFLVLTGENTHTGGTTVNSGAILQIGMGGATGSVAGNITNNGQVIFFHNNNHTHSGICQFS